MQTDSLQNVLTQHNLYQSTESSFSFSALGLAGQGSLNSLAWTAPSPKGIQGLFQRLDLKEYLFESQFCLVYMISWQFCLCCAENDFFITCRLSHLISQFPFLVLLQRRCTDLNRERNIGKNSPLDGSRANGDGRFGLSGRETHFPSNILLVSIGSRLPMFSLSLLQLQAQVWSEGPSNYFRKLLFLRNRTSWSNFFIQQCLQNKHYPWLKEIEGM